MPSIPGHSYRGAEVNISTVNGLGTASKMSKDIVFGSRQHCPCEVVQVDCPDVRRPNCSLLDSLSTQIKGSLEFLENNPYPRKDGVFPRSDFRSMEKGGRRGFSRAVAR